MANPTDGLAGSHILVIEDEVTVATMLEDMLQDFEDATSIGAQYRAGADVDPRPQPGRCASGHEHSRADDRCQPVGAFLLVTGYSPRDGDPPVIKAAPRLQKPFDEEVWRAR